MMNNTTNTYEEVYAQLKGSIVAGDKNGDGVAVGDIVKVSRRKELYKIHKIVEVSNGNNGEPYPVFELTPLQPATIFRGEHQIELLITSKNYCNSITKKYIDKNQEN